MRWDPPLAFLKPGPRRWSGELPAARARRTRVSSSHRVTADTCFNAPAPRRGQVWGGAGVGDRSSGGGGRAAAGALPPQLSGARETMERRRERPGRTAPGFAGEKDGASAKPTVAASTSSQAPFLPPCSRSCGAQARIVHTDVASRLCASAVGWEAARQGCPHLWSPRGVPGRGGRRVRVGSRRVQTSPGSGAASLSARLSGKAAPRLGDPTLHPRPRAAPPRLEVRVPRSRQLCGGRNGTLGGKVLTRSRTAERFPGRSESPARCARFREPESRPRGAGGSDGSGLCPGYRPAPCPLAPLLDIRTLPRAAQTCPALSERSAEGKRPESGAGASGRALGMTDKAYVHSCVARERVRGAPLPLSQLLAATCGGGDISIATGGWAASRAACSRVRAGRL